MLNRRRISASGNEVSKSGVIGRTISPNRTRTAAVQRGPINQLQQTFPSSNISNRDPKIINTKLNFDLALEEGRRDNYATTWSSNKIGPRPPFVRGTDTNSDLVVDIAADTQRHTTSRADQLKKYLETLEKSTKNVEGNGISPTTELDGSQSLSVFSLSSDESEEKKSTVVDSRKKVSYIKTNYMKEVKEEEPQPALSNLKTTQNARISEALLKAQQFSNKYKQLKVAQSGEKQEMVNEVEKEIPIDEKDSMSSEDAPSATNDTSKSSTTSSIKSLVNVKDLMLDLPSTSPESKLENHQVEDKLESIQSDSEVKTENSSKIKSEISSEKVTSIEPSERIGSSTSKHVSESVASYSSDFEKSVERDQSTQESEKSEMTSERDQSTQESDKSEMTSETESETVVSSPAKTVKKTARSNVRHAKTSTKTERKTFNVHLNRSTQTMTTDEFNLNNFYNNFNYSSPSIARPYVCYFDPRLISSTIITTDALNEISTRNPNVILIDDMLKQQMVTIRSMIESQRRNYVGAISTLKPTYHYTTWEDTRKIIENHSRKKKQVNNNG